MQFPWMFCNTELEIAPSADTPASKLFAKIFVTDKHKDESKSGLMCLKFQTCLFLCFPNICPAIYSS